MTQKMFFCDVSHWQGDIDFDKLAASGCLGVIAKCSQGTSMTDDKYTQNRAGALGVGMCFASYHFLEHGNAAAQMDHYLATATPVEGERVVIDYEENPSGPEPTVDDLVDAILRIAEVRPDLAVTVYGASKLTDDVEACDDEDSIDVLAATSLWAARYSSSPPKIAETAWGYWDAWQYTDSGQIDGVNGNVDLDTFNGEPMACVKWFGPAGDEPEPQPVVVTLTITAPEGVTVLVNGVDVTS